ncbi:uncharacterized protein LOC132206645 isoform X2 [Stegostoma tigrinum]|uniref:uncharacterized protein LOC132206645 isoform X2 n=1 Tax=Stegostoma tigrinum TaxID=3053191 RepID=UPI00287024AA|nr:uncharacterized protein LOC132206645 isoform X2 [Stegostoma tigrinum]
MFKKRVFYYYYFHISSPNFNILKKIYKLTRTGWRKERALRPHLKSAKRYKFHALITRPSDVVLFLFLSQELQHAEIFKEKAFYICLGHFHIHSLCLCLMVGCCLRLFPIDSLKNQTAHHVQLLFIVCSKMQQKVSQNGRTKECSGSYFSLERRNNSLAAESRFGRR